MKDDATKRTLLSRWLRHVCRRLPPVVAYRIYYRYLSAAEGTRVAFTGARALIGPARLTSTMADVVDAHFAFHGCSEWFGLALAKLLVRPGCTVFEIGANLGTDTLNLAGIVGPQGKVVAVEPVGATFATLVQRVEANGFRQVVPIRSAVSDRLGTLVVQLGIASNSGMAFMASAGDPDGGAESVPATTLDQLFASHGPPAFVWMDIEGFELAALRGGLRMLSEARPFIYTEVDRGHLERAGDSLPAFAEFVRAQRYRPIDASWRLAEVRDDMQTRGCYHTNWLLVPEEKLGEIRRIRFRYVLSRLLPRL